MRPSRVFLTWVLLASAAAALSTPERWRFDIEARDALGKRQDPPTATTSVQASPTDSAATSDPAASSPAPTSTDAAPTSEPTPLPTSDTATPTSSPLDSTSSVSSPPPTPTQTGSSSSVGLLFTQTTPSSRPVVTVTTSPTSDANDSNVPFFDSKYHQLIIALASISGALLLSLIVTAVIAFRARADNDLLHDRLSRYEQGFDLPQRGKRDSAGSLGGYGRLSLNDPDDMRHSRRSLSEAQLKTTPAGRRLSGAPMGSGTPPGGRRVTFGGSESIHSSHTAGSSEHSTLPPTSKGEAPLFPDAHVPAYRPASMPPLPHDNHRTNSAGSPVRRLPTAPGGPNTGYEYPFTGGR